MTDADVDGAHIASLLITFFYREMPQLIEAAISFLAVPPLYRLTQGGKTVYARDEAHKDELLQDRVHRASGKVEIGRFKGLGEMPIPTSSRTTTMDPKQAHLAARRRRCREARGRDRRFAVERLDGNEARGALRVHPGAGRLRGGGGDRRYLSALKHPAT
jgi:topoisomerase-4 subunit B